MQLEKDGSSRGAVEFQVVLLAGGPGSRMSPLSTEIPKPLLPIANRPMISYQLEFLERCGFSGLVPLLLWLEAAIRLLCLWSLPPK